MTALARLSNVIRAAASLGGASIIPADAGAALAADPAAVVNLLTQVALGLIGLYDLFKAGKRQ